VTVKDKITAWIDPGKSGEKVSIRAELLDPFAFSDVDPAAAFGFVPGGLDYSFSLFAGTAFPTSYATAPGMPGAVAEDTRMIFRGRLAPGAIAAPDAFWGDALGAIDLYTLTLQPDAGGNVAASLLFGASTGQFALDVRDRLGNVVDPTDPAVVAAIAGQIAGAFSGGMLQTDLQDIFTVGFVPQAGVTEFTLGGHDAVDLAAFEPGVVPEPGTLALALSGVVVLVAGRARRVWPGRRR
jgi:hypothetical protein